MSKYKVLTDGNGSDLIQVVGLGVYAPLLKIEKLLDERDNALAQNTELVAQVEYVKSHFYELIEVAQRCDSWESFPQKPIDTAIAALESTPTQHLRDRDAEVVSKFIEFMHKSSDCQLCERSLNNASEYAEKVRRGEA